MTRALHVAAAIICAVLGSGLVAIIAAMFIR